MGFSSFAFGAGPEDHTGPLSYIKRKVIARCSEVSGWHGLPALVVQLELEVQK